MQFFFYCNPDELKEIFSEVELTYPIVYEPRFGHIPCTVEIDTLLRKPLYSCQDFYQFGKAYRDIPPLQMAKPAPRFSIIYNRGKFLLCHNPKRALGENPCGTGGTSTGRHRTKRKPQLRNNRLAKRKTASFAEERGIDGGKRAQMAHHSGHHGKSAGGGGSCCQYT